MTETTVAPQAVQLAVQRQLDRVLDQIAWEQARQRDAQVLLESTVNCLAAYEAEAAELRDFLYPKL